ncbi:MAG: winged helix-turn-helix transcriptional regulator, partial [Paramuribaculum sp.]|nr:winged helix-turn-helix transcriptional regulator [Paramuribaculum sp.]
SGKITNRSLQREERLEIPYKALREAIINSLCHRQWEKYNLLNSIAIYDDRVEIGNPGILPSQITPENIKEPHDSYPYNVKMAEALYRSMWLENWGSGAKRIIEACREQEVEEPTWRWDGGFVYVTFNRPVKAHETAKENLGDNVAPNVAPSTTNVARNVAQNKDDVAQSLDERILQIIKSNPSIRREDIAAQLSVNKKTVERHLKNLGINWEGHSKTGHWKI